MSSHRMVDISCDVCGCTYPDSWDTAEMVRRHAHANGWRRQGKRDLCEDCSGYAARMGWGPRDPR
jgi:hypothetical protein